MTWHWAIRSRATGEEQLVQSETCYAPYDGELFEIAELPRAIDPAVERWDWETGAIVCRFTPEEVRDRKWEAAKAYRELRRNAPLPIAGVVPDQVVVADCDLESRLTIAGAVQVATIAQAAGQPYAITFTDHLNAQHTLDAAQVIAIGLAVATFNGLCHAASQAIRDQLDAALAGGASAEDILAIDITAGYPAEPAPEGEEEED